MSVSIIIDNPHIISVAFRSKDNGWKRYDNNSKIMSY